MLICLFFGVALSCMQLLLKLEEHVFLSGRLSLQGSQEHGLSEMTCDWP